MRRNTPKITRVKARKRGMKRYFTGRQCSKGHVAQRLVSNGGCVKCNRDRVHHRKKELLQIGARVRREQNAQTPGSAN
jgi:hypothetical protein